MLPTETALGRAPPTTRARTGTPHTPPLRAAQRDHLRVRSRRAGRDARGGRYLHAGGRSVGAHLHEYHHGHSLPAGQRERHRHVQQRKRVSQVATSPTVPFAYRQPTVPPATVALHPHGAQFTAPPLPGLGYAHKVTRAYNRVLYNGRRRHPRRLPRAVPALSRNPG